MGNIHSEADLDKLVKRHDEVSETYDVIMTYTISQFAVKHVVSDIAEKSLNQFMKNTLRIAMRTLSNLKEGKLGLFQLNTGSTAEGLNLPQLFHVTQEGVAATEISDSDMLQIDDIFVDITPEKALENKDNLYVDTSHTYPGFVRIRAVVDRSSSPSEFLVRRIENGEEVYYLSKYMINYLRGDNSMSGPAVTREYAVEAEVQAPLFNGKVPGESSIDMVYALNLTEWPDFMRDWKSRQNSVTSLDTVLTTTGFGCFLVGAVHRYSLDPDIEWRISCSLPELVLAHGLTVPQRQAYMTFKYLVKEATKGQKGIMTYHLKTTLFWTLEKTAPHAWREDNLAQCLYLLLDNFINFLVQKKLPNYFIPQSNLFEHLSGDHIRTTLHTVIKLRETPLGHLLKFQQTVRLQGQSVWWNHGFESVLLPHLQAATNILSGYCDYPTSSSILLRQCLFDSTVHLASWKLSEGALEDAFAMMLTYLSLPAFMRYVSKGLALEEHVYNFLVHLCHQTFLHTSKIEVNLSFLDYAQQQLGVKLILTDSLKQKLSLLKAFWNKNLAAHPDNENGEESRWDQSALVYDSLNQEDGDIISLVEHSCFFLQLWSKRYREDSAHSYIMESGKSVRALQYLILALHKNQLKIDYQFYEIWKLIPSNVDHMEPNLTAFLKSARSCQVPHEIIGLWVNILMIHTVLLPSIVSFMLLTRRECSGLTRPSTCEHSCDHAIRIANMRTLLSTISVLSCKAEQLLYVIVKIFNARIMNLDFVAPGDRQMSNAAVNFLLALTLMYQKHWEAAFAILNGVCNQSLCTDQILSKYRCFCALLVIFDHYNDQPMRKALIRKSVCDPILLGKKLTVNVESETALHKQRWFPRPLYDRHVDTSSFGDHHILDPSVARVNISELGMEIELHKNEIIFNENSTTTTYPYDRAVDDINDICGRHLGEVSDSCVNLSQREMLDQLTASVRQLHDNEDEILEKIKSRYGAS